MNQKAQERMTNRVMLTIAISFVACVAMYYIHGAILMDIFKNPTTLFIVIAAIFAVCAVIMMVFGVLEGKKNNLSIVEGYKTNLKARLFFNFEIFFIVAAVVTLIISAVGAKWGGLENGMYVLTEKYHYFVKYKPVNGSTSVNAKSIGYANIMILFAILIAVYNVALIAWTYIYQAVQKNKVKQVRLSKKASARAELKAKRSKLK